MNVGRLGAKPLAMLMIEKRTISIISGHLRPYLSASALQKNKNKK
jgi:hypothetical protein